MKKFEKFITGFVCSLLVMPVVCMVLWLMFIIYEFLEGTGAVIFIILLISVVVGISSMYE